MRQMLLGSAEEGPRRTALKAAYNIGPEARDIFLRAAIDGEPALRESVRNTLYLIWRNESPAARRNASPMRCTSSGVMRRASPTTS